jgi:hypothetical protein
VKKAYSHLGHLNKPVLQVLTVAFGQADEIAVCFAQACILSTGEAYLPPGATLQLKPCTVSAVGAVQHSGIRKNGTAEALAYKLDQRMVHGGFNEDLRLVASLLEQRINQLAHGGAAKDQRKFTVMEPSEICGGQWHAKGIGPRGFRMVFRYTQDKVFFKQCDVLQIDPG